MKKFTFGLTVLVIFLCLVFAGCNNPAIVSELGGNQGNSGSGGIGINSSLVKTVYVMGEPLDLSGLKVTVGSTNYDSEALIKTAESVGALSIVPVIGTELTTPGFQDVTVTVPGVGSTSYKIFVNSDTDVSADFIYTVSGDESTGYKLGITGKNGGPTVFVDLPDDCTGFSVNGTSDGDQIKIVTISQSGDNEPVENHPDPIVKVLAGISVTTAPARIVYTAGDTLDLSGLVVTANYNYGVPKEVAGYTTDPAEGASLEAGTTTVTVTYGGQNASFVVTVNAAPADRTLTGIEIASRPDKVSYYYGQSLDLYGLVVNPVYDGVVDKSEVLAIGLSNISGYYAANIGKQIVSVTYQEQTAEFEVTVLQIGWSYTKGAIDTKGNGTVTIKFAAPVTDLKKNEVTITGTNTGSGAAKLTITSISSSNGGNTWSISFSGFSNKNGIIKGVTINKDGIGSSGTATN